MLQLKREIAADIDPFDFTARMLGCGYFLYVQRNRDNLIFKRKAHPGPYWVELIYKPLNPFNLLYVQVLPKKVIVMVHAGKIAAFLVLLNLSLSLLLFMAGIPIKGSIFLPSVFLLLEVLMVFFYGQFKMAELVKKMN